jgi:hypothetical protein
MYTACVIFHVNVLISHSSESSVYANLKQMYIQEQVENKIDLMLTMLQNC